MDEEKKECGCGCGCGEGDGERCGCDHSHGEGECGCGHSHEEEEFDYEAHDVPLPPPTILSIVSTLAQQAMVSMGIFPNPMTGKSVFLMNQATYLIDSVDVLYEKTKGNCTDDESNKISQVLSELRMLYVRAASEKKRRDSEK